MTGVLGGRRGRECGLAKSGPPGRPAGHGDRESLTDEAAENEENERARIQAMEERQASRTVAIPTAGDRPRRRLPPDREH